MRGVVLILGLTATIAAGPAPAQETFEVPADLELQDVPLVIDLDVASLEIVLDPNATPTLRALSAPASGAPAAGAPDAPRPALAVSSDGGIMVVRRVPDEAGEATAVSPRLILELVHHPASRLQVFGSELDIVVTGQRAELEDTRADEDEAEVGDQNDEDDVDEDEDGDDEDDDEEDGDEQEAGAAAVALFDPEDPHRRFFDLAASDIDLIGVEGTSVRAVESYLHATGTRGRLTLAFESGTADITGHRGTLELTSLDSEITLSESVGRVASAITGGSLIAKGGSGQLNGRFIDALLRVEGWRAGRFVVAGIGATVEARGFAGVRLELRGDGLDVALDDLQGHLLAELAGGSFTAGQVAGPFEVKARDGAELSIDGVQGQPTLTLENSSARLVDVAGTLKVNVRGGRLDVDGAQRLDLAAANADVVAGRFKRLIKADLTDSRVDLDLWELASQPRLSLRGATEARVRLRTPCTVKLGEVDLLAGRADVTGCELHSQSLRRTRQERRGVSGNRRIVLTATLSEDSTLEVEGAP